MLLKTHLETAVQLNSRTLPSCELISDNGIPWQTITEPANSGWSQADIKTIAKECWTWLNQNSPSVQDDWVEIISALWILGRAIYVSGIPPSSRGASQRGGEALAAQGATEAPMWWSQVSSRTLHPGFTEGSLYHAEDGACYGYEMTVNPKGRHGQKYPDGAFITSYGRGAKNAAVGARSPCDETDSSIDPDCFKPLQALEIAHSP